MALPDIEQIEIASSGELWNWLGQHHARDEGVLLITWKKAAGDRYVGREAVLDALIAHGWIDGRRYVVDDLRTAQLITPRKERVWAASYKDRAQRLVDEGRMHPSGQAAIDHAKAAGTWDELADVDALVVPDDLQSALAADTDGYFAACPPSYRRNVLRWLAKAKTDATRTKRIDTIVDASWAGRRLPQM